MKGHVLKGKLLVKQDPPEEVTQSGVILPGSHAEKPPRGTVVLTGEGNEEIEFGDRVVFAPHSGTVLEIEDKDLSLNGDYILLDNQHVLFYKR